MATLGTETIAHYIGVAVHWEDRSKIWRLCFFVAAKKSCRGGYVTLYRWSLGTVASQTEGKTEKYLFCMMDDDPCNIWNSKWVRMGNYCCLCCCGRLFWKGEVRRSAFFGKLGWLEKIRSFKICMRARAWICQKFAAFCRHAFSLSNFSCKQFKWKWLLKATIYFVFSATRLCNICRTSNSWSFERPSIAT